MPRRTLKLVHTSDVHIHSEGLRGEERPAGRALEEIALRKVVDTARSLEADLLLIAGDLFDSSRIARPELDFVMATLGAASCPIVVLPGNHDCYDEHSVYRKVDFRAAGSHVHPLMAEDGDVLEFPELHATVWGRAMVEHDHANRPLEGVPERRGDTWHVGIAHGHLVPDRSELRSSLITPEEIGDSGLDYLALGHVHVFREVSERSTTACYSGSPSPQYGRDDWGSVAVVTLDAERGVLLSQEKLEP